MRVLNEVQVEAACPLPELIDALEKAFKDDLTALDRSHVPLPGGDGDRLLLMMPAFDARGSGIVKLASVFPDNRRKGLPTIQGGILALDENGAPKALLDGGAITRLRTAAASALAARYLARENSSRLLVIGTGALAPYMAAAHAIVRPINHVVFWGRKPERVAETAARARELLAANIEIVAADELAVAVSEADIVSCATSAFKPVLHGRWLTDGAHIDLVGSFSPDTRECDDETVSRASIFVDTMRGALTEAGDILQPIERQIIRREDINGDLYHLASGRISGRKSALEITLFKSVGTAIEDLAAVNVALSL